MLWVRLPLIVASMLVAVFVPYAVWGKSSPAAGFAATALISIMLHALSKRLWTLVEAMASRDGGSA